MLQELHKFIEKLAVTKTVKGQEFRVLSYQDEMKVSSLVYDLTKKRVQNTLQIAQLEALKIGIIPVRYIDNVINLGIEGQIKLLQSKVAVVGVGRLGSHIVENLARLGVGHLTLIDGDRIDNISLNSQSIALPEYLDVDRTTVMSIRVHDINGGVTVESRNVHLNGENVDELLEEANMVVSSSNVLETHETVSAYCKEHQKVFVYGTLNGWKGYVCSIFPDDKSFSEFYNLIEDEEKFNRTTFSYATAIIAGYHTAEIVEVITKGTSKHRNQLLKINVETMQNEII